MTYYERVRIVVDCEAENDECYRLLELTNNKKIKKKLLRTIDENDSKIEEQIKEIPVSFLRKAKLMKLYRDN
jgi:hypothetical protein